MEETKLQIPEIGSGLESQESSKNRIPHRNSGFAPEKVQESEFTASLFP
jgi:hypothetical protein